MNKYNIILTNKLIKSDEHKTDHIFKKRSHEKYHRKLTQPFNRIRNESVTRSKSFQEQGVKPLLTLPRSRFYVKREMIDNDFNLETVSQQNIEISIDNDYDKKMGITVTDDDDDDDDDGTGENEKPIYHTYKRKREKNVHSGHILGRIFRRMRKFSLGWRKSRCKIHRGELVFFFSFNYFFYFFF